MYRALTAAEASAFYSSNPDLALPGATIPGPGLCVGWSDKSILVFRMTTGEIRLIDVGDKCLAHFGQRFPAPEGLADTALRYLRDLAEAFMGAVWVIVGVIVLAAGVLIYSRFRDNA